MLVSAFETARMNSPSVIFIDEFQALFIERNSSGSSKLSTTLLQCMDDVKQWRDVNRCAVNANERFDTDASRVLVLAATNNPWMIDKAFLRPGRFDRVIHIDLPGEDDRVAILRIHVERMKTKLQSLEDFCRRIARLTEGFSGADIAALCRAAAVRCVVEKKNFVEEVQFIEALKSGFTPSSDKQFVRRLQQWK
jgi:proteasome regulatory subunit